MKRALRQLRTASREAEQVRSLAAIDSFFEMVTERFGCSPSAVMRAPVAIADPSVIAKPELAAEFCGWSNDVAKIVAPLSENAEQNSNYLRLNAQRELRKCEEFAERFHVSFAASVEVKDRLDRAQPLMFSGDAVASRADGRRYVPTTVRGV